MLATTDTAIHAELQETMVGRCVLAHADGFMDVPHAEPHQWADALLRCMAQTFEILAAEVAALRLEQPELTAEDFARLLLEEAEAIIHGPQADDDELDDDDDWHTHPSLTAGERNPTLR